MIVTVSSLNSFKVMSGTWAMHLALFFGLMFGVKAETDMGTIDFKALRNKTLACHAILAVTCFWTRKTVRSYAAIIYGLHYTATIGYMVLIS